MEEKRRPLYGGEQGLRKRSDTVKTRLRVFAKSDFMHDFGEGVDTRDKYTGSDLQRFVEISQRFNLSKTKALIAGFNTVIGSNPYTILKSTISSIYPEQVVNDAEFVNEESVLELEGVKYSAIKDVVKADKKVRSEIDRFQAPIQRTISVRGDDEERSYTVSVVPMKIEGKTANIASSFYNLSKRKTNFAIIIDAAGGLSLTSIKKALYPVVPETFTFYIIENIENDSDSATKLKNIDKQDKPNVNIVYLRDRVQSVIYPPFNILQGTSEAENLYGNARLTLSRSSGQETEADFVYPDNRQYNIPNVSQNANVKNASLNLLAARLAGEERQAHLYPYLKRVGDWCQALSLLDTSRVYDILDENHVPTGETITLKQLQEKDVEVALVTLDRILLAYALNIGVNVFFTSGSDITSLMYFKNNEIELTGAKLQQRIAELLVEYDAERAKLIPTTIPANIAALLPAIVAAQDYVQYLRMLRSFLSNVSMMRFEFDSLQKMIDVKYADIAKQRVLVYTPILKQSLTDALSYLKKYSADNLHNQSLLGFIRAGTYPDFPEESEYYVLLSQGRPSRRAITDMTTVISTKMYSDAEQVKKIFDTIGIPGFTTLFKPADPSNAIQVAIFKGFSAYRAIFSGVQRAGGKPEIDEIFDMLRTFEVTPVKIQDIDTFVDSPGTTPQPVISSFSQARGLSRRFMYRGESMEPYTVCDNFIVTSDRIVLIPVVVSQITPDVDLNKLAYIVFRLLLLYNDMLQARYESLSTNEEIIPLLTEDSMVVGYAESDVNFIEHKRLNLETNNLLSIVSELKATNDIVKAINVANQLLINKKIWTNETVELYANDPRSGIRNNDFTRTFAKIQGTQEMLLTYFQPPVKAGAIRKTRRNRKSKRKSKTR